MTMTTAFDDQLDVTKPRVDIDDPATQAAIAEATHQVITDITESDGVGMCSLYTPLAWALMLRLTGDSRWTMQAGALHAWVGPVRMRGAVEMVETETMTHAWLARPDTMPSASGVYASDLLIVDLAARHHAALAERDGNTWSARPVDYVWHRSSALETFAGVRLEYEATETGCNQLMDFGMENVRAFANMALAVEGRLGLGRGLSPAALTATRNAFAGFGGRVGFEAAMVRNGFTTSDGLLFAQEDTPKKSNRGPRSGRSGDPRKRRP
ncbi:hypothetical protein I6A60_00595 [Frankia sp. AgB1.9]|uniref:hypothetical protein n=1 Tax=unclassified Frankia TaxID=2632575 RepID=UPI00193273EC|nr:MULTISPECIES: hypothetical protein [unclassified Frankia]MBL7487379.1 hypothetical protein [Frankia sp. AgW1.1]MBL7546387.1 hypothetical protein [Frankia sp. AgB1.9]MBL7618568.1 hypothetical protein [Frankia sp. AgB1.8]